MKIERDMNSKFPQPAELIGTKKATYEVTKIVGKGSYGAVFEIKRLTDQAQFAMKCELIKANTKILLMDCNVLRGAQTLGSQHFCDIYDRGRLSDRFRFIIMKLVGRNLWELRSEMPERRFTLNTSLKIADQCLEAIEHLHGIGFLHRDVKSGNFAVGRSELREHHTVYMLDFGLCRQFSVSKDEIRAPREVASFRGTTRYASRAALRQQEQSRKDDIESWLYIIVEWTAGSLPWRKFDNKYDVLLSKESVRHGDAMNQFFNNCPKREFASIMRYIDSLEYSSVPDYDHIYYCIQHAAKANKIGPDDPLDWDLGNRYHGPAPHFRNGSTIMETEPQNLRIKVF